MRHSEIAAPAIRWGVFEWLAALAVSGAVGWWLMPYAYGVMLIVGVM